MNDLELLREIFKDPRLHIGIGVVTQLGLATNGNILRVQVNLLPEQRAINCEMTFADVNDVTFPQLQDLVLVAHVDGDVDEAFVIKVVSTDEEGIPKFAQTGNSVKYARAGKKLYIGSTVKIGIGRPNVEPTEPLVLGNVCVSGLTALCNAFLQATQIGQSGAGPVALDPTVRTALNNFVSQYLTTASTNILSQIAFTERGV